MTPVIIVVRTTSDDISPADGQCSLRAAIMAANDGSIAGDCPSGTAGQDAIFFSIGSGVPVINVGPDLPAITQALTINGNSGGSTRVELHGPGSGTGLNVQSGDGSVIGSMVVDGFETGIRVASSGVTITGSVVGPNTYYGIYAYGGAVQIGGTTGTTPGGACTGDCNLVSGNGGWGLYLASSGTVQGNLIGTIANGSGADANGIGITVSSGSWTIGGTSAAARNVVSGNVGRAMDLHTCTSCSIEGNFIGTNAAGTAALANGSAGIYMEGGGNNTAIGGTVAGSGNVISGNLGNGIELHETDGVIIEGNRIGTTVGGATLGNGAAGIFLAPPPTSSSSPGVERTWVGYAGMASAANTIAYNVGPGVRIAGSKDFWNQVRWNSIHHNGGKGISLESGANQAIAAPSITGVAPIAGTACPNCPVDVYSDSAGQGRIFEGSVQADGTGHWSYHACVSGPNVTATNTDFSNNTSEFSAPVSLGTCRPDGRIRKGSGTFVGNNIYNTTGVNQTKTGSAAIGSTITFGVSIQNDSTRADSFTVLATGTSTAMYGVRYFSGTTEITVAVVAGTYTTFPVAPGAMYVITAKVKVNSSATVGSSVARLVTISSVGDNTKKDAVKFIGKRA